MKRKQFKRAIIGSTALGLGALLHDSEDSILIERSAMVLPEWTGAYAAGDWSNPIANSDSGQELLDELRQRQVLTERGFHTPGLGAVFFKRLHDASVAHSFMTEITQVEQTDDGFAIDLHHVGGHERINCHEIIDTTNQARSYFAEIPKVLRRSIVLQLHNAEDQIQDHPSQDHYRWHPGAFINEASVELSLAVDADWSDARNAIHTFLTDRPEAMRDWQCVATATQFCEQVTALGQLSDNWQHIASCNTKNALAGFEQGAALTMKEVLA